MNCFTQMIEAIMFLVNYTVTVILNPAKTLNSVITNSGNVIYPKLSYLCNNG